MAKQYEQTDIIKKLAADIGTMIKNITNNLEYDKTYNGTIIAKDGNLYTVKINDTNFHIKSNYNFQIGANPYVLAPHNNMRNLILQPGFDEIMTMIKSIM